MASSTAPGMNDVVAASGFCMFIIMNRRTVNPELPQLHVSGDNVLIAAFLRSPNELLNPDLFTTMSKSLSVNARWLLKNTYALVIDCCDTYDTLPHRMSDTHAGLSPPPLRKRVLSQRRSKFLKKNLHQCFAQHRFNNRRYLHTEMTLVVENSITQTAALSGPILGVSLVSKSAGA